ncbi:MAG: hypothetical protein M3246_00570, partial [Actinomycetota bacterium]|nr:hypothetical protein [Actinomycetota bacterium]
PLPAAVAPQSVRQVPGYGRFLGDNEPHMASIRQENRRTTGDVDALAENISSRTAPANASQVLGAEPADSC